MSETENDLISTITAAYDEVAAQPGSDLPPDDDLFPAKSADNAAAEGRARDEQGRFAPKDSNENAKTAEPAAALDAKPAAEPKSAAMGQPDANAAPPQTPTGGGPDRSAPPARVGVATKAKWNELPEDIRNDIWEREERMDRGMARYAGLAEYAVEAEKQGRSLKDVMQAYSQAEENLISNPVATLAEFCKMTNTNPLQVAQFLGVPVGAQSPSMPQSAPQGTPPIYSDPRVDELLRKVEQREAMEAAQRLNVAASEFQAFMSNTKQYPYVENVRGLMAELFERDLATSLEDAYQKAIYLDPTVRKQVEEDNFKARMSAVQQQQQAQNARVAVQNAKRSSGSISGSPIAGGSSGNQSSGPKSVADSLREAYDSLAG